MIKVGHQYRNASSGNWHTLDPVPGHTYFSAEMLLEGCGYDLLTEMGKAHIKSLMADKGWKP